MAGIAIKNLTRRRTAPRAAFSTIAKNVLPTWDLSLAFVGPTQARTLNTQLRHKEYVPNVLSYALGPKNGEIIICLVEAEKQAAAYMMGKQEFILYLFIHALLHLKGWVHGGTMEACERRLLAKFAKSSTRSLSNVTTHSNRNRHRHVPSKDRRRRRAR